MEEQIADLKAVTLDSVRKFHTEFYSASHGEMVALGQFDPAKLQQTVAELLGSWNTPMKYKPIVAGFKVAAAMNQKIDTPDKANAQFEAGERFKLSQNQTIATPDKTNATFEAAIRVKMSENDADYPAMILANHMFGGSLGSRMPNRIRNLEGLSYSVSSRFTAPIDGDAAVFSASAISAPQNTAKVEASFVDELRKTKKAYRDERTVSRSQEAALARTILSHFDRTMKWDAELDAKIEALTPEQINAAFRRNINPDALCIVKAGDFK